MSNIRLLETEKISEEGMYANAAKRQHLGIIAGQTALALKLYKAEHGKYPAKLSELVPRYLPQEYVSPYGGGILTYTVEGDEFLLAADGCKSRKDAASRRGYLNLKISSASSSAR